MRELVIVDDNAAMREKIVSDLKSFPEKFNYHFKFTGQEALNYLKLLASQNKDIAMVITDIHMPIMDGLTLLKLIRSTATISKIPVLVLSSINDSDTIVDALKLKATNYLIKPWLQEDLIDKVEFCLSKDQGTKS